MSHRNICRVDGWIASEERWASRINNVASQEVWRPLMYKNPESGGAFASSSFHYARVGTFSLFIIAFPFGIYIPRALAATETCNERTVVAVNEAHRSKNL